uniref:Gag polyprotein n=1 Tax=Rabbit endogenous lentivirus type K TaxID=596477 RepID=A0A3T0PND5_9RETR|nr:gag protein [Rabbit endogenous lentivirus type K]
MGGTSQSKEYRQALVSIEKVKVLPGQAPRGKKVKCYSPGNVTWACKLAAACTGRDLQDLQTLEEVENLLEEFLQKGEGATTGKDYKCAVDTLKVLICCGKGLNPKNTGDACKLYDAIAECRQKPQVVPRELRKEEKAKEQSAYPIMLRGGRREYEPVGPGLIAAWLKQVQEHGLTHPATITYFGVISVNFTSVDINMLLNVTPGFAAEKQLVIDKIKEKAIAWDEMHPPPPADAAGPVPLTSDQIRGIGLSPEEAAGPRFADARTLYRTWVLEALQECQRTISGAPKAVSIRQGPKEPYPEFINRLFTQIDMETSREDLRTYLKDTMSIQNANEECKKLLRNLRPGDSLEEKMYACREFGSTSYKMAMLAEALKAGDRQQGSRSFQGNCYRCGKKGHMARNCKSGEKTPLKCHNCGRTGHMAKVCKQPKNGKAGGNVLQTMMVSAQNIQSSVLPSAPPLGETQIEAPATGIYPKLPK